MTKQFQYRIGVRAEICFHLLLESASPTPQQLRDAVVAAFNKATEEDGGFAIRELTDGRAFPEWNSVDREIDPEDAMDCDAIRIYDSFEIDRTQ